MAKKAESLLNDYSPIHRWRKYDVNQSVRAEPPLAPSDAKALCRLVKKYGRSAVVNAVINVRERVRGDPFGDMHMAQWIEDRRLELVEKGKRRGALTAAIYLAYEYQWGADAHRPPEEQEYERLKKLYQRGMTLLKRENAVLARHERGKQAP